MRLSLLSLSLSFLSLAACGTVLEGRNPGECADGADNDGNGDFDCADAGCAGSPDCTATDDTGPSENAAPSGAAIAISPAAPVDTDDLSCTIVTQATDPNGDAVTYRYTWSVNGADAGVTSSTLSSALTSGGDAWTCTVTPTDGTLDGTPASASATVGQGNQPPSAPTVSISPAEPTDDDVLTCVIDTESVDPDGDAVTFSYAWTVDRTDAGVSGAAVDPSLTTAGQTWTCTVTANDGDLSSVPGSASVEVVAACVDDYAVTFSGGSTETCCCTGGNAGNSYILTGVSPALSGASTATIEFWLYLDSYTQYGAIMSTDGGPVISNASDCGYGTNQYKTAASWGGGGLWSQDVATLGVWQHYALVFDAGTVRYFIDGRLQSTASAAPTTPVVTGDQLYFGGWTDYSNGNNQLQVNGSYRSIRISATARYATDFTPAATFEADGDTLHLYGLDEGSEGTVYDSVDSSYTGTIVHGATTNMGWSLYDACP